MQFRSDPEFEEARINHLEDLVLQLQDRIEKLELCVRYPLQEVIRTDATDGQQIAKAIKAME